MSSGPSIAKGKAAPGFVELHGRDADIEDDAVQGKKILARGDLLKLGESRLDEREPALSLLDKRGAAAHRHGVAIKREHLRAGRRQQGAAIAPGAEGGVEIAPLGARGKRGDGLGEQHRDVPVERRARGRHDPSPRSPPLAPNAGQPGGFSSPARFLPARATPFERKRGWRLRAVQGRPRAGLRVAKGPPARAAGVQMTLGVVKIKGGFTLCGNCRFSPRGGASRRPCARSASPAPTAARRAASRGGRAGRRVRDYAWRSARRGRCRARARSARQHWSAVRGSRLPVGSSPSSKARRVGEGADDGDALLLAAGKPRRTVFGARAKPT